MKKLFMKSFLGVPIAIFLYEIINILFSIFAFEGQYYRLDEFELNQIIISYIELALLGYILVFSWLYDNYLKNAHKTEIEIAKKSVKIWCFTYFLFIIITGIIEIFNEHSYAIIAFPLIMIIFGIVFMFKGFTDVKIIKKINQKIKENQSKKD